MSGEQQIAAALVALLVAMLASRSIGMTIGAVVMQTGAFIHDPVLVALGAAIAAFLTPDKPEGGAGGGRERHA